MPPEGVLPTAADVGDARGWLEVTTGAPAHLSRLSRTALRHADDPLPRPANGAANPAVQRRPLVAFGPFLGAIDEGVIRQNAFAGLAGQIGSERRRGA